MVKLQFFDFPTEDEVITYDLGSTQVDEELAPSIDSFLVKSSNPLLVIRCDLKKRRIICSDIEMFLSDIWHSTPITDPDIIEMENDFNYAVDLQDILFLNHYKFGESLLSKDIFRIGILPVLRLEKIEQKTIRERIEKVMEKREKIVIEVEMTSYRGHSRSRHEKSKIEWIYYPEIKSFIPSKIIGEIDSFQYNEEEIMEEFTKVINSLWMESELEEGLEEEKEVVDQNSTEKANTMDRIKACIDANIPLFLHGKPGEGKSQRVHQIDPKATVLELSLLPVEEIQGIMVYKDGEAVKKKPEWFEELERLCQEEPDETHILFLDEFTNAYPSVQQMVYSLILNRKVGGTWNLPENVRIIAAGNEVEDSIVASEMPEPLKDRFAHITINTSLEEWLLWAQEAKIHPAIISYISAKGERALRCSRDNGRIFITPRTWEFASKQLIITNDVDDLESILGEEIQSDFIGFLRMSDITLDMVLSSNIDEASELLKKVKNFDVSMISRFVESLAKVDEKGFSKVRAFLKGIGDEYVALFELLWVNAGPKNDTRLIMVQDARQIDEPDELFDI